jgi:hypothetical protein
MKKKQHGMTNATARRVNDNTKLKRGELFGAKRVHRSHGVTFQ